MLYTLGMLAFVLAASSYHSIEQVAVESPSPSPNSLREQIVVVTHTPLPTPEPPPNFSAYTNTKEKKRMFLTYFGDIVDKQNQILNKKRAKLLNIEQDVVQGLALSTQEKDFLNTLAQDFSVKPSLSLEEKIARLRLKVNGIPPALVLAQAANESAWGTSRFAKQGNNFFGQWCFRKGCGLVPVGRNEGSQHEVRKFATPAESVAAYFKNINTHRAYRHLRKKRETLSQTKQKITGTALASGLIHYSERGEHYVDELRGIIRFNKLETLPEPTKVLQQETKAKLADGPTDATSGKASPNQTPPLSPTQQ